MPSAQEYIQNRVTELSRSLDLKKLDEIIESYDYQNDPVLNPHFHAIEEILWNRIETYAIDTNEFGVRIAEHLRRVSQDGHEFMTEALGFSEKAANNFHAANLFHDLGKTHDDYNPEIWDLPHRPTKEERAEKRLHTIRGAEIFFDAVKDLPDEAQKHPHIAIVIPALQIFHHEKANGTGYVGRDASNTGKLIKAICVVDCKDGDLVKRGHHVTKRTEKEALLRMKSIKEYDPDNKYAGAFDDMLNTYIAFREAKTGQKILQKPYKMLKNKVNALEF